MPNTYYIDGYNVIHHSSLLRPLAQQDFEAARDALIEKVGRFCVATGCQAKIVFDGRGHTQPAVKPLAGASGLEVLYSPAHKTADALIERVVYSSNNRRGLVVVSGDRGIRDLCRNLNAFVMEPDNFIKTIHESDGDTRNVLEHLQRGDTLNRIENRLDGGALGALEAIKKNLQKQSEKTAPIPSANKPRTDPVRRAEIIPDLPGDRQ